MTLADYRPVHPVRRGVTTAPTGGVRMVVQGRRQDKEREARLSRRESPQGIESSV